jgi:Flp pilus assembly protein TadB
VSPIARLVAASAALTVGLLAIWLRRWVRLPSRPAAFDVPDRTSSTQRWWRRRPPPPTETDVAAWCERVSGGLRSGRSLRTAVVEADGGSEVGMRPFPDVVQAVQRGRSLGEAFRSVDADPSTPTGLSAPVLAACAELGGATAEPVDALADVLVARATERTERLTASAQARLSARVLTTVPFGVAGLLIAAEPSVRQVLPSPAGAMCVVGGGVLNLAGWWWMRTMIRGAS